MTAKKITDFTDGGTFQANDAILIARSGQNYFVKGATVPSQANVAALQSTVDGLQTDVEALQAGGDASALQANVTALQGAVSRLQANAANLATVARTGSYADLTGKPTIPTVPSNVSAFTNDAGYLTSATVPNAVTKTSQLTNDSGFITAADIPPASNVPTKTSQLTNDSGFITVTSVPTKTSQLTNDSGFLSTLGTTGVVAGTYTNATLTVGSDGRLTYAASGAATGGGSTPTANAALGIYSPFSPPKVADFPDTSTIVTGGTIARTDDADVGLILTIPPVSGDKSSAVLKPLPSGTNWSVTIRYAAAGVGYDFAMGGLALLWGGTAQFFGHDFSRARLMVTNYSTSGGFTGTSFNGYMTDQPPWLRIFYDSSTNLTKYQYSPNGKAWATVYTQTGTPTKIGLGFGTNRNPLFSDEVLFVTCPYWSQSF